ncbi:hypothetical protein BZG36_02795 [Bifiguratus adelaidae]|uniref:NmrA-like domain-containing protein n=1 Tax=Bifiguratus adelaidae TaxID=1938954 RepID=A0A261Y1H3_9FUNG|nr:hypothetical protein BZG36_02795 [Bifiguratus adelaidae]
MTTRPTVVRRSSGLEGGLIFVTGADGEKGFQIAMALLSMRQQYGRLRVFDILAAVNRRDSDRAMHLVALGARVVVVNPLTDKEGVEAALQDVIKLCLVIDPLGDDIKRAETFQYGQRQVATTEPVGRVCSCLLKMDGLIRYADAANKAGVRHVLFLTTSSMHDPKTPPTTPSGGDTESMGSYRIQFLMLEAYLAQQFPPQSLTLLRHPGILYQHLLYFSSHVKSHNAIPMPFTHNNVTIETSNLSDIATAAAFILVAPKSAHGGKSFKITSPRLYTLEELEQRASDGLGRGITVENIQPQSLRTLLYNVLLEQPGHIDDKVTYLLELWGLQERLAAPPSPPLPSGRLSTRVESTRDLELLTGKSGVEVRDWFREMRHVFIPDLLIQPLVPGQTVEHP